MKILLCAFIMLTLSSCSGKNHLKESYDIIYPAQITSYELDYMINTLNPSSYMIVDFRQPDIYNDGHIHNALSLSYSSVESLTNIPNYKDYKIIFYDEHTIPYFIVERQFKKMQITNYAILKDGYKDWRNYIKQKK